MNPQRCRSVKGLGWEMAHTGSWRLGSLTVRDRAWLGTLRHGKAPPPRKAQPCVAAAASKVLLFLVPKDGAHDLFSNGFFRNMAEDPLTEDVVLMDGTAEVRNRTIRNSTILKADSDIPSNASCQDASLQGGGKDTDPRND